MSLPEYYNNNQEYFKDVLEFLNDFRWIYETSNTEYIKFNVLKQIPESWMKDLLSMKNDELNYLPYGFINENWSNDFKIFLKRINKLKPKFPDISCDKSIFQKFNNTIRGLSMKKLHEVQNLSNEINQIVMRNKITSILDIGSGLGYLTEFLYNKYNIKHIIGLEGNKENCVRAELRQTKYYPNSSSTIKFINHFITDNSMDFFQEITKNDLNFGMIGLHACGDLTITSLKLFSLIENIKILAIMPCCYHKMIPSLNQDNYNQIEFKNFPLCNDLKNFMGNYKNLINRPFLRLASQQTASRWKNLSIQEHLEHAKNMYERSIIDAILNDDEKIQNKRNSIVQKDLIPDFEIVRNKFNLLDKLTKNIKPWTLEHEIKFNQILETNPHGLELSEILTGLQASIQIICENLVLLDKVNYINENGENIRCSVKKIVSDELSPRCFALIAEKQL